jgi:hypothetical protein
MNPADVKRILRLLRRFGIDPLEWVRQLEARLVTARLEGGRKRVAKRARQEHYTPADLSGDDLERTKLIRWSVFWLVREALPDLPGMGPIADFIRDPISAAIVAQVGPQVSADLKERDFLELLIPAIEAHVPDVAKLVRAALGT